MAEHANSTKNEPSSGKQTVTILILLILSGVLLYMVFIFFAKFQAYQTISGNLKVELQQNYNHYLALNYGTVDNVIRMNNYNYTQVIKTLGAVFGKIHCSANFSCEINGIIYQFDTIRKNDQQTITNYHAHLSENSTKAANNSFVVAQTYSKQF